MLQRVSSTIGAISQDPVQPVRFMPHWLILLRSSLPWYIVLAGCYAVVWVLQGHSSTAAFAALAAPYALGILVVGFAIASIRAFVAWRYTVATVFDDRVEYRVGLLTVRTSTVEIGEIANIDHSQGPLQRLLGSGDLFIDSRASAILTIRAVSDVLLLRDMIRRQRSLIVDRMDRRSTGAA